MIKIAICDDSKELLNQIADILHHWKKSTQLQISIFEDGDSLIKAHTHSPFDILLLDVVMPLLNGIDTAKEIREKDKIVKIVFLTSSKEYAIDSYQVKASNYLLKPVIPSALYNCLDDLLQELHHEDETIIVKNSDGVHRIPLFQIKYIEAQGKHIEFKLQNNTSIKVIGSLYAYESKLNTKEGFYKCHRSYIVNIHQIKSYTQKEIIMQSGDRIPLSRSCQKAFESIYFSVIFAKAGEQ